MAIGIVESDEFDLELERLNYKSNGEVIDLPTRGRGNGNCATPDSLRKIIGENAIEEGSAETKELTRALGISDSSLSAYKNGATSTVSYHEPNEKLKNHIDNTKLRIASKARHRLLSAIDSITKEKLEGASLRDAASVATAMSAVIRNIEPEQSDSKINQPTFVIYAPQIRKEESFDVITVNE